MSGFAGRGVGVGDDRGKGTPNFVHPFRLSSPPSFHLCPGLPLPCCGHLQVHHLGFCQFLTFLCLHPSFRLQPPLSAFPIGFPGLYPSPPYPEPDSTPLPSLLLQTRVSMIPSSCPVSFPLCLPCLPSLSACIILHPPNAPLPEILHSPPQIKETLSFFYLDGLMCDKNLQSQVPRQRSGWSFPSPLQPLPTFPTCCMLGVEGERAAALVQETEI